MSTNTVAHGPLPKLGALQNILRVICEELHKCRGWGVCTVWPINPHLTLIRYS